MSLKSAIKRRPYLWGGATLLVIAIAVALIVAEARHDPQSSAARSARTSADVALMNALDDVEAGLSLTASTGSAVDDMCRATNPVSQDRSITCERRRYRVYSPTSTYPDASSLARSLNSPWQRRDTLCDADLGLSTACFRASTVDLELMVVPVSAKGSIYGPKVVSDYVESDLWKLKVGVSSIVVIVSSTYHVG